MKFFLFEGFYNVIDFNIIHLFQLIIFVKLTVNNKYKSLINSLTSDLAQSVTANTVYCVL